MSLEWLVNAKPLHTLMTPQEDSQDISLPFVTPPIASKVQESLYYQKKHSRCRMSDY